MEAKNNKLENVWESMNYASKKSGTGKKAWSRGLPDTGDLKVTKDHIQGIVQYNDCILLSHNDDRSKKGFYCVLDARSNSGEAKYKHNCSRYIEKDWSSASRYEHPGSMQKIGKYAILPIESHTKDANTGKRPYALLLYDLSTMNPSSASLPTLKREIILSTKYTNGAAAVGITDFITATGEARYLLIVVAGSKADLYMSDTKDVDITKAQFTHFFTHSFGENKGYENCGLLCSQTNEVFFAGLRVSGPDVGPYKDHADLYKIDFVEKTMNMEETFNYKTSSGSTYNKNHFRWGACVEAENGNTVKIMATERHYSDSITQEEYMDYDVWHGTFGS